MPARHQAIGKPSHRAEDQAIRFLVHKLPDTYAVFSNIDLPTGRSGQTYEHDAVVVAPHAVFTIEMKSWGGRITGNRDRWTLPDGMQMQSPIPLLQSKARILKGQLQARRQDLSSVWVQGLVFLSALDADPHITPDFEDLVTSRKDVISAITDPSWLQLNRILTHSQRATIEHVLADGKPVQAMSRLGPFELVQRLSSDDRPFDVWLGVNTFDRVRRVLHVYPLADDSEASRSRVRAHALREAELYNRLYGGPDLLRYFSCDVPMDADPPCVVLQFEDTTPLLPLGTWAALRRPGAQVRLQVASRVARAASWVHQRGLVHRRLTTDSVLVSDEDEPKLVRVCGFELARDLANPALTISGGSYAGPSFRGIAPEMIRTGEASPASDLFSFGAMLYELMTGRALFQNTDDVLRDFEIGPVTVLDSQVPTDVIQLLRRLLDRDLLARPESAERVAEELDRIVDPPSIIRPVRSGLQPGKLIHNTYELKERLGRGATSTAWKAHNLLDGQDVVLKVAGSEHVAPLRREYDVLRDIHHKNLVECGVHLSYEDGSFLVLNYLEGVTASEWIVAGDPMDARELLAVGQGLLEALGGLHRRGWLHRDVKPDNLMLAFGTLNPTLLDLGLAARQGTEGELAVGSIRYKDPLLWKEGKWTPANDVYAAFLVLYEILTGVHPFGGGAPEPERPPRMDLGLFPETLETGVANGLSKLIERALAPQREGRPFDAIDALTELQQVLGQGIPENRVVAPLGPMLTVAPMPVDANAGGVAIRTVVPRPVLLRADAVPETPLSTLHLSARAQGIVARMGLSCLIELAGLDMEQVRRLPNVGSKTVKELRGLVDEVRARFGLPDVTPPPVPAQVFFPALVEDSRPLQELGQALTPALLNSLEDLGLRTVGDLAGMPEGPLRDLPGVGASKLARVREAMMQLAGLKPTPATLADLEAALTAELGQAVYEILAMRMGLRDGRFRTPSEAATALDLTRQRTSAAVDFETLQCQGSIGHWLADQVRSMVPAAGFVSLVRLAESLERRLPRLGAPLSPLGFARLGVLLNDPDPAAVRGDHLDLVCLAPWTAERVVQLCTLLSEQANWPPLERREAEGRIWDALELPLQTALIHRGVDASALLDAVRPLCPDLLATTEGSLFTPPVLMDQGAAWLRRRLRPVLSIDDLQARLVAEFQAVEQPADLRQALLDAGYRVHGNRLEDPERVEEAASVETPLIDAVIPRQRIEVSSHLPPVVSALAASVDRGGFRVVALPPASHHQLSRRLAEWLGELLDPARVRFVDVDRVLLDAFREEDRWSDVEFFEERKSQGWRWAASFLKAALDDALKGSCPGTVTVLGRPCLLGPLDLMHWLSGFYDQARGGRYGLIVLAMPGGIHDNRVRLNERYNLPYTPDMSAVYLEGS